MSPEIATGAIRFDGVTKQYRLGRRRAHLAGALPFGSGVGRGPTILALDEVSFEVKPGESFALIGANGAGKSTALKCLAAVTKPTAGTVTRGGRVVALIELGVGFHPDLTGIDNARFAVAVAGLRGRDAARAVDSAVEFSEIEKFMTTPVKHYSSGMYARLSFGIAVSLPADILIIDEILAVGDLAFQRKCYSRLAEIQKAEGRTLLFVSHNEWVLKETCTSGVLLAGGKIIGRGSVPDLLNRYHRHAEATPDRFMAGGGQEIVIEAVRLVPDDQRVFQLHDPIAVECEVVVGASRNAVVGIVLFDRDGRLVWGVYSSENGVLLTQGRQRIVAVIDDLAILPGPCVLQVFAYDESSPVIEDLRRLDIVVEGHVPQRFENGLVHVVSHWSLGTGE